MSDLIERPIDAADPTYPDAERCAQVLEACADDLLTEARFVRWQGREIKRLTAALKWEQHRAERLGTHGPGCADWGPAHYECAIRERDNLRRQLAEAELDARRYRWLRNEANTARKCDPMVCIYPLDEQDLIDGDRLDVAIDDAMGASNE